MCGYNAHPPFIWTDMLIDYDTISRPVKTGDNETVEDLQLGGLRLIQKKNGFRLGMDSVLLADFAYVRREDRVGDFGTGTGALPLLLWGRGKGARYEAIEIQEHLAETAARTMILNGLEERVRVFARDAGDAGLFLEQNSLDAIVCNPPYGEPGSVLLNPMNERSVSRHQKEDTLQRYLKAAYRTLKGRGKIALVYPAPRMLGLMRLMQEAHLEPKRFRLVYPRANQPANLVLVEGVKDAKPMLHPMPPLVVFEENGDLTNELKSVYHIKENSPE